MSNIDKALRSTSERDWFEDWFKREFHPDKTGPYIKDQLFFAVRAARSPLLDELEAKDKQIAEQGEIIANQERWIKAVEETIITTTDRAEVAEKRIAELEDAEKKTVEMPTFGGYVPHVARELQAAFRIACDNAGINVAAAGKGE